MPIPARIKFLGHEYEILQVSANELEGYNGDAWFKLHRIRIDKDIPESRKQSTFLHEILEVINSHFDLKLDHHVIECLEETLYAVLKDNGLLKFG